METGPEVYVHVTDRGKLPLYHCDQCEQPLERGQVLNHCHSFASLEGRSKNLILSLQSNYGAFTVVLTTSLAGFKDAEHLRFDKNSKYIHPHATIHLLPLEL